MYFVLTLKGEIIMTPEEAFGKVLKEIRQEHSLSQEELGFESGCHRTYISLLERGRKSPSLNTTWTPLIEQKFGNGIS
jgi:transcriptional regulator with XRE-family HTH domain